MRGPCERLPTPKHGRNRRPGKRGGGGACLTFAPGHGVYVVMNTVAHKAHLWWRTS
jgi:hypothetical protein